MSNVITKIKALERKHRNSQWSAAVPPALQQQIPIIAYELAGQIALPSSDLMSTYQSITVDEYENPPSSSSRHSLQHRNPAPTILNTSHASDAGLSNEQRLPSKKRKGDASLSIEQAQKKSRQRTCQKCGNAECAGGSSRKYCKNSCQDCGKMECHGRNSQHPMKPCTVGWNFHHKELK